MVLTYRETGVKSSISLWLDNSTKTQRKVFFCMSCGHPCFEYYNDALMAVVGEGPMSPQSPTVIIMCRNSACKTKYQIYR